MKIRFLNFGNEENAVVSMHHMRTGIFFIAFVMLCFTAQSQPTPPLVQKAIKIIFAEYGQFMDSNMLVKHLKLDPERSYYVNYRTQQISAIPKYRKNFIYDEFTLSFVLIYKNDTLAWLGCRFDTSLNLMALGTPENQRRHGDILPPYAELIKGKLGFDYKKLRKRLKELHIVSSATELIARTSDVKEETYVWKVITSCPEVYCRRIEISAINGKLLADTK